MKAFLAAITLVIFFSCKKESDTDTVSVEVGNCSELPLESEDYILCFDSVVEDSRCPANAVCVWQGVAKAKFRFTINNQEHPVTLSTSDLPPYYSNDTTVAGYHLKLTSLLPYPGTAQTPAIATVEITQ
jgi:hypothetical protein